jgi:hypothetical protein
MKRALLLGAPLVLGLVLPGCPIYPDQPYGCAGDDDCRSGEICDPNSGCYPAGNDLPTYRTCHQPSDCAANETCTSANQCRVGSCTTSGYGCVAGYRCGISGGNWSCIADVLPAGGASSGGRGGSVSGGAGGPSAGRGGVPANAGSGGIAGGRAGSPAAGGVAGTGGIQNSAGRTNGSGGSPATAGSPATGGSPVPTGGAGGLDTGGSAGESGSPDVAGGSGGFDTGGVPGAAGSEAGAAGSQAVGCTATYPADLTPCDQPSYECTYCGMDLDSACRTCACQPAAGDAGDPAWAWSCSVF